jgi:hypothetical protein
LLWLTAARLDRQHSAGVKPGNLIRERLFNRPEQHAELRARLGVIEARALTLLHHHPHASPGQKRRLPVVRAATQIRLLSQTGAPPAFCAEALQPADGLKPFEQLGDRQCWPAAR